MSSRKKIRLQTLVAIPVTCIVLAAFALSIAAVVENLHFINATNQMLSLVGTVRTMAGGQSGFAQNAGEDIWADLEHVGQIPAGTSRTNPWHGDMRVVTLSSSVMRMESDLPTHDCRRLALYFLDHQPKELGLLAMEAQSVNDAAWTAVFPVQSPHERLTDIACGKPPYSRLALVFRIR